MIYSAYVPVGCGSSNNGYISFKSFTAANGSTVKGLWYADARSTETTYYPVSVATSTASDDYTKGYWKVAVLVDGTYENLIYDTLTDDSEGKLEYSFDGSNYTLLMDDGGSTDLQRIDTSRWYVNAEGESTVYWRWTPYYGDDETFDTSDDTCFVFVQDMDDGMYVMVTEAANTVSIASGTPTTPARSRALAESGFDFEALGMRGFGEDTDDDIASEDETEAETEDLIPDEDADLPEDTDLSNEAPSEDESYDDEVDEE